MKFWLRPQWLAAILITMAAGVHHFYYWRHIGGLWRDEVNLVNLAGRHSFAELEKDSFPILMPLIVHCWLALGLGGSDLYLRLIGLLIGLGTLAALWISAWKIRGAPPLIGLVLLSLNSTLIFFGDSLRAYGLGSLFAIALTASAFLFLQKPSTRRAAWLALFAILSVQVLYHNAVLVAAICFGAWAVCWRRADGRGAVQILIVAAAAAASLLPYVPQFVASGGAAKIFRTGVELRRFFRSYEDTLGYPLSGYIYVWAALGAIIVLCASAGLWRRFRARSRAGESDAGQDFRLFAAVTLILAVVGFPVFFWRAQMPMQSWYLLPFLACAVVCFDAALPALTGLLRATFLALVVGTAMLSTLTTASLLGRQFSDVNIYAEELTDHAAPGDYILVFPWMYGITFDHYFKGHTDWDTVPPLSDHSIHRVDLVLARMENTNAIAPVLDKISQTLQSGHRVWFLTMAGIQIPRAGVAPMPPPPPVNETHWSEDQYSMVWASETLQTIANHSMQFRPFKYSSPHGYITENMDLFVADGWTNSAAAP